MKQPKPARPGQGRSETDLRLNPQRRRCAKFDPDSVAAFRVPEPGTMGLRVVDNCAEEHIQ